MTPQSGIYKIVNNATGKIYVGSAVSLKRRWWCHKGKLNKNIHDNPKLQSAWNKYGEENFRFEVLEIVNDKSELLIREQHWIDLTKCCDEGYNILRIAGSSVGYRHTDEFKNKRAKEYYGRKLSEDQKKNISASLKGKKKSKEHSENIRLSKLGNKYALGNRHTEEAKKKMSRNKKVDNNSMKLYGQPIIILEKIND